MRVKTTLELERPLYMALKQKASAENKTLKKLMDEIIVAWLKSPAVKANQSLSKNAELFPRAPGLGARFDLKHAYEMIDTEDFVSH